MKLINVKPSLIGDAANLALSNYSYGYEQKVKDFIQSKMNERSMSEESVRRYYDMELYGMQTRCNQDKLTLRDLIIGAQSAINLGCMMELDNKDIRLICDYL
ncbi:hypothetical protein SCRM01_256 [Synechococcus phage S-CRM01]|uniref:hypothetical protein n=1 Tax=Synechococcus phage S-CRM01 TaxID=1026955 RepID=UPI000209E451|nr:hypothetical protein SCRM01_256 [Synechococcus phage S-CRM01]AEC53202.1 hypothetical protein SCRM01_256 [Synechococcus phage S-CRM01]